MRPQRVTANLRVADIEQAKGCYTDFLGLDTEEFNLGWVARYTAPDTGAHVQLLTGDASAPEDAAISVHTDDIDSAYAEAQRLCDAARGFAPWLSHRRRPGGNVSGHHRGCGARRAGSAAVVTATVLAMAACGASGATPAPPATTTVPATKPAPAEGTTRAAKAARIEVPSGVGLDYQSAQDLWRAAGLHVAPAKDATGENRIPVIDANWVVLSQTPAAGAMVEAGSFITATVKKDSDS